MINLMFDMIARSALNWVRPVLPYLDFLASLVIAMARIYPCAFLVPAFCFNIYAVCPGIHCDGHGLCRRR